MQGRFLFLGTSGSMGVPVLGCKCSVCLSDSQYNRRSRCAALIKIANRSLLIDSGPEIRYQLLNHHIDRVDGALITHSHFDHVAGFDDLKAFSFSQKQKLPILLSSSTFSEIEKRYDYLLEYKQGLAFGFFFDFTILDKPFGVVEFTGMEIKYLSYSQSGMQVTGFKIGNLAYLSDIKEYSEELIDEVKGIDILIISALRQSTSPMHMSLDEAIAFSKKIQAKKTYFTHMAHEIDYERDSKLLPNGIEFSYDGLEIPFNYDKGII